MREGRTEETDTLTHRITTLTLIVHVHRGLMTCIYNVKVLDYLPNNAKVCVAGCLIAGSLA